MNQQRRIHEFTRRQKKFEPKQAARLGDVVKELMEKRISPAQSRFAKVEKQWNSLLPQHLREHCRIADISDGQMKVLVDSPSYRFKLQTSSLDYLEKLQQFCPGARIKKIKFVLT